MSEKNEGWKLGLPPGKVTCQADVEAILAKYEVYFSPAGAKWHRLRPSPPSTSGETI